MRIWFNNNIILHCLWWKCLFLFNLISGGSYFINWFTFFRTLLALTVLWNKNRGDFVLKKMKNWRLENTWRHKDLEKMSGEHRHLHKVTSLSTSNEINAVFLSTMFWFLNDHQSEKLLFFCDFRNFFLIICSSLG